MRGLLKLLGDLAGPFKGFGRIAFAGRYGEMQLDVRAVVIAISQRNITAQAVARLNGTADQVHVLLEPERRVPVFPSPDVLGLAFDRVAAPAEPPFPAQVDDAVVLGANL